jgi:signal transduction histidine kinase
MIDRVQILRGQAPELRRSAGSTTSTERRGLADVGDGMPDDSGQPYQEPADVGEDIAHELRTPITRARAILERGRSNAGTLEELQAVVDRSIGTLDRALAAVTGLLRIAAIEHARRYDGFGAVHAAGIVREVAELYEPIAEDRNIVLSVSVADVGQLRGDRDLLFEAIANLVDNAIKFTPIGGQVQVALTDRDDGCVVTVADSGPGIPEAEREAVTRRFYRSERDRRAQGSGLGLALVAAITRLHGFRLAISGNAAGCVIDVVCPRPASAGTGPGLAP